MTIRKKAGAELPNPLLFNDGRPVRTAADWRTRRKELFDLIVAIEYGGIPPAPPATRFEELHTSAAGSISGAHFRTLRVIPATDRPFSFAMSMLIPPGKGPFPVVLTGDACWRYASEAVAAEVLRRGYILAQFNRVELAPDIYNSDRVSGLYPVFPEARFGALAAWAWGYHRCVDALSGMDCVDAGRIAIAGHSRGGKASLLAGATDERIALTCANNSGAGGAGCFRVQGPGSETLADLVRTIPYWFGPRFTGYVGRETRLPFDQHFLKALVAPRALLTAEALGDAWANPPGTWQTHLAAREVYRFLNAEDRIGIWYREGGHNHGFEDWLVFLDFADARLRGRFTARRFDINPFPDMPAAFKRKARRGR